MIFVGADRAHSIPVLSLIMAPVGLEKQTLTGVTQEERQRLTPVANFFRIDEREDSQTP